MRIEKLCERSVGREFAIIGKCMYVRCHYIELRLKQDRTNFKIAITFHAEKLFYSIRDVDVTIMLLMGGGGAEVEFIRGLPSLYPSRRIGHMHTDSPDATVTGGKALRRFVLKRCRSVKTAAEVNNTLPCVYPHLSLSPPTDDRSAEMF